MVDQDLLKLQREVRDQLRRADRLLALLRVVVVLWKISGYSVSRNLDPAGRLRFLAALDRSHAVMQRSCICVRRLDGSRTYLNAIIDNFSRRTLAWKVSARFDAMVTAELLVQAASGLADQQPTLLADGGVENCNSAVHRLIESGPLRRLLAQTEIAFSTSLIEWSWRTLKNKWLYLNGLDVLER